MVVVSMRVVAQWIGPWMRSVIDPLAIQIDQLLKVWNKVLKSELLSINNRITKSIESSKWMWRDICELMDGSQLIVFHF